MLVSVDSCLTVPLPELKVATRIFCFNYIEHDTAEYYYAAVHVAGICQSNTWNLCCNVCCN